MTKSHDTPTDRIIFNRDLNQRYGFARFCYAGEAKIINGIWDRKVQLAVSGAEPPKQAKIAVAEGDLIQLHGSPGKKIIHWPDYRITSNGDITTSMKQLSERAGWNQTSADLQNFTRMDPMASFLALLDCEETSIPLGSGAVFPVGDNLSWIGMILVHPEVRRQGIAKSLMRACVLHARLRQDQAVVGLDATAMGKHVYEAMGFRDAFRIWRCIVKTKASLATTNKIDTNIIKHIDQLQTFLHQHYYAYRLPVIRRLLALPDSYAVMARKNDKITGIGLSRPGRLRPFIGPLLAENSETAENLMANMLKQWKKKGQSEIFIDTPEYHFTKKPEDITSEKWDQLPNPDDFKLPLKITPVRSFMRMYQLIDSGPPGGKDVDESWHKAVSAAKKYYQTTKTFLKMEMEQLIPIQYGIGGPEIG